MHFLLLTFCCELENRHKLKPDKIIAMFFSSSLCLEMPLLQESLQEKEIKSSQYVSVVRSRS